MKSILQDIQKSFNNEFSASITLERLLTAIALTFVLSLLVVLVYKLTYNGVAYNKGFACSMILLSLITASVIMAISTNIVLSLGMVGALSIVRFRTAVKDPGDTIFLFWSIAVGLMCGAGLVFVSILMTVAAAALYIIVCAVGRRFSRETYLIVIRYDADKKDIVNAAIDTFPRYRLKSKTSTEKGIEVAIEVKISKSDFGDIERLREIDGVNEVHAVVYNGSTVL